MRSFLTILLLMAMATPASAGRCRRTFQSYSSSHGWSYSGGCYQCHKPAAKSKGWREAIVTLQQTKQEYAAFVQSIQAVAGAGTYAQQGSVANYSGQYSSYPAQGASVYGVSAYASNPLLDLGAVINGQQKLAQQLTLGAQQSASDTADIANLTYTLENDRAAKIAAYQAIASISQGAPAQPTVSNFRFNATVHPNGQVTVQQDPVVMSQSAGGDLQAVLESRCAECHAGPEPKGKFDLSRLDAQALEKAVVRINLPPDDPKAMPQRKTADGFEPGEPLSWRERHAIEDALINQPNPER